ncbi:unnamed protein product [Ambrosiozyma monospora]|uniref:Unnamed protein product n=1 Tax=Ambrosiozyma monospora TaxID=43982 RepID=A0ACB5SWZ1_AMBMO|nr:unnamed protein product [Ambrosiozyma monospora]
MPPKKKRTEHISDKDAKPLILDYLKSQYRPYGVTDIVANLHNKVSKVAVTRILEALHKKGELICKTYGRSSFYCYKEIVTETEGEQVTIEAVTQIKEEYLTLDKEFKTLKEECAQLESQKTNKELLELKQNMSKEINESNAKLNSMNSGVDINVAKEKLKQLTDVYNTVSIEYQKRLKIVSMTSTNPFLRSNEVSSTNTIACLFVVVVSQYCWTNHGWC